MFTPERLLFFIFALSFVVGAVDCFCGNKLGLGARFTAGLQTFAPLFLTMAGFLVLAPMLAKLIAPCARVIFPPLGADPGIFAGLVLANDNGAYPLAKELCLTPEGAGFGGMLVGSVVGVNVICMPLVTQLMTEEDRPFFFKGLMFGMIAMPAGVLAGGLAAHYSWAFLLRQMPPLVLLAVVAALMLRFFPELLVKILTVFAKFMEAVAMAGISAAVFTELTGIPIPGITPPGEALKIVGSITVMLAGVYVFMEIASRIFRKALLRAGEALKINSVSVMGFLTTAANSIPTLSLLREMDPRGKLLNCAFLSSGAFMLGDHLAYCGAVVPELIFPMLVTKGTAAFLAVLLAVLWTRKAGDSQQNVLEHEEDRKDDEKTVDPVPAPAKQVDDRP